MQTPEHVAVLRREGELFADAVGKADLDATVPTCPEWSVRELAHHMGRVHRWAAAIVRDARPQAPTATEQEGIWGAMPVDGALDAWLRDGHRQLVDVLTQAPADVACWYFLAAPSPLAFWARRQAHETAVHRVDAQGAVGAVDEVDPAFAADGIDELIVRFFGGRSRRLRSDTELTLAVATTDTDDGWLVHIGPEGQRSERGAREGGDCTVRGPAGPLYLALWNRRPLAATAGLKVDGNPAVLELWRTRALVRWS
jgi:uncharacterized protein (TIGR03083 family)